MNDLNSILNTKNLSPENIRFLLSLTNPEDIKQLARKSFNITTNVLGNNVYYRGLIEFSNECSCHCLYCGLRAGNTKVKRYRLTREQILDCALWAATMGYGSCVLQAGEKRDEEFIGFVADCVKDIKKRTRSEQLPEGLGITLSVGEQSFETYQRWREAGAHRYLLRMETSNPNLFAQLHPKNQRYEERLACLASLRKAGFQVGTGVMIGLPGQTIEDLANDVLFFKERSVDMIGMGPYITHSESPLQGMGMMEKTSLMVLALNMISVVRLVLNDVNIVAATALQALDETGREKGIAHGANVLMPNLTPFEARRHYQLYEGKPCVEEGKESCTRCLQRRVQTTGRTVGWNKWGDSLHSLKINHKKLHGFFGKTSSLEKT